MSRYFVFVCSLFLFGVFTAGCNSASYVRGGSGSSIPQEKLLGVKWQIASFDGHDAAISRAKSTLFLKTDTSRFEGKAACNTYNGSYEITGQQISLDVEWITEIGCDLNDYESALTSALETVETYEIVDDALILRADKSEIMRFEPVPAE